MIVRGRWLHWGSPWGSGSSGEAGLIGVRALEVIGVTLYHWVHWSASRFIRNRWVNWGVPWGTSGSSEVIGVSS